MRQAAPAGQLRRLLVIGVEDVLALTGLWDFPIIN